MEQDLFSLAGRVALVTGASAGLGQRFATALAGAGARVVLAARRTDRLGAIAQDIASSGGEALAVTMDVTDEASVAEAFDTAQTTFGCVDVLVNNAGVATGYNALEIDTGEWDRVLDTNLKGAWLVAKQGGQRMVDAGVPGSIINIASLLGLRVAKGVAPYAISKAGVIQMTRVLALEWARFGIRVNAIAPGWFMTDMNRNFLKTEAGARMVQQVPQRRVAEPHELDGPLLLLASGASSYMTGSVITVDGGHLNSSL